MRVTPVTMHAHDKVNVASRYTISLYDELLSQD